MSKLYKIILFFLIFILVVSYFTTAKSSNRIDDLAYVLAIGIDKGDIANLKVTFQFSKPMSDKEASSAPSSYSYTIDCESINSGINLINSYISKQANLSHCKIIVFSEDKATDGISEEITTLVNNVQIRNDVPLVISKCDAKDFIEHSKPDLESSISQYYELNSETNEYNGFTDSNLSAGDFYINLTSTTSEPCSILGGINNTDPSGSEEQAKEEEDGYSLTAGETTFEGTSDSESIGLAVFKDDKLVGELDALDSICHLIITNKMQSSMISIDNPQDSNSKIDLYIYKQDPCKIKVQIVNGAPFVKINCKLTARALSMNTNSNYTSKDVMDSITNSLNTFLESKISDYLYETSKIYNSDISGIGKYAIKNFSTNQKWEDFNWKNNYKNCFFDVNVDTSVKTGLLLTEN